MMTATFPGTSVDISTSCIALENSHVDTDTSNIGLGDADVVDGDYGNAPPVIMPNSLSELSASLSSRCRWPMAKVCAFR